LDNAINDWDADLLARHSVARSVLPRVCDFNEADPMLRLSAARGKQWPALQSARLFLGVGDGAAATVGSGCRASGVVVSLGTSAAVRKLINGWQVPPRGLWCYRVDRVRSVLGGSLTDGGGAVDVVERLVSEQAAAAAARATTVICVPLFHGERSLGWRGAHVTGAFVGVTASTTRGDLVQAACAGTCALLRQICDALGWTAATAVWVNGGAARSAMWTGWLSAALDGAVLNADETQATSRGVALLLAGALAFPRAAEASARPVGEPASAELVKAMRRVREGLREVMAAVPWTRLAAL